MAVGGGVSALELPGQALRSASSPGCLPERGLEDPPAWLQEELQEELQGSGPCCGGAQGARQVPGVIPNCGRESWEPPGRQQS